MLFCKCMTCHLPIYLLNEIFFVLMSRNTMTRQSIIEEIDKAFRNVNAVCQQYF